MIPALEAVIAQAARQGVEEIVIGMAHRGRLNVLTSIMGKSYAAVFSEFQGGVTAAGDVQGSGDVKYHLGASADRVPRGRPFAPHLAHPQPLAPGGGQPGGAGQGARQAGDARRQGPRAGHGPADPRRRRAGRPGDLLRGLRAFATARLPHRRHGPHRHQQPDRLHHEPGPGAHVALSVGSGEDHPGTDLPRERRRPGGGRARLPDRGRLPPALQGGRGGGHLLLPPSRPQRGRRAGLHAARDVSRDRRTVHDAADLYRAPGGRGRAHGGRRREHDGDLPCQAGNRARSLQELPPQQGGLARRRLGGHRGGAPRRAAGRYRGGARGAGRDRPGDHARPGRLRRPPAHPPPAGAEAPGAGCGRADRLGHGGGTGLRLAAA